MWIWGLFESVLAVIEKFLDWRIAEGRRVQDELDGLKRREGERRTADAAREAQRAADAAVFDGTGKLPDDDPFRRD